jgi:hypothetical protein
MKSFQLVVCFLFRAGGISCRRATTGTLELRCQFSCRQVILRRNAEGVGNTIEEGKHGCDIHGFSNLFLLPARVAEPLHVVRSCLVSRFCNQLYVLEQCPLARSETGFVKLAVEDCLYALICGSLNTQEVSMTVQSIRASVQIRDMAGNHLLMPSRQMPFREMDGI